MAGAALIGSARADTTTVFNEIMYHPAEPGGAEWIELHNMLAADIGSGRLAAAGRRGLCS
ncbi:MAG: hypothetical protein R3F11_21950 [Verrucomicrobiales bacterium]